MAMANTMTEQRTIATATPAAGSGEFVVTPVEQASTVTPAPEAPSPVKPLSFWLDPEARERLMHHVPFFGVALLVHAVLVGLAELPVLAALWSLGVLALAIVFVPSRKTSELALPDQPARGPVRSAPSASRSTAVRASDWQAVAHALPDPAILLNGAGSVLASNEPALALFPALRPGYHLSAVIRHPDLLDAVSRALTAVAPVTVTFGLRSPVERRIMATAVPLPPSSVPPQRRSGLQNEAPDLLLTMRDLTEQDRIHEMRADFIANASHELRTPLASLLGFIETLRGSARNDPAARDRFLGIMHAQAQRMSRLIDDLLALSRIEMSAHVPPEGLIEINDVIAHVGETLQAMARDHHVTLVVTPLDAPAFVRGEHDELVQVFQNLTQNAIKYGREGGRVEIRVSRMPAAERSAMERGASRLVIEVIDDGPGIAPMHLPRLTERFYRVDAGESRKKGGTGLGLAIVKHILNRHRGELRIRSQLGVGSTFTVGLTEVAGPQQEHGQPISGANAMRSL